MKRILLVVSLAIIASGAVFAQKKALKEAKSALDKGNFSEARELIKPAFTDPETATSPDTWKLAGDIEFKAADKELDNEKLKEFNKKGWNEETLYNGMYQMIDPYLIADSLAQLPDAKGKIKNKVRKDIVKNILAMYQYYPNGGVFFNQKEDPKKASELFEMYWKIPKLDIFSNEEANAFVVDSTYQIIKYYTIITAIQSGDKDRSVKLLNEIIAEPYVVNSTQKESDPYELLANEYITRGDTVKYMEILQLGSTKFPSNQYFTTNLINEYIKAGNKEKAIDFLDKAIATGTVADICMFSSVKASLYLDDKNYESALNIYRTTLDSDPTCERAMEGLGLVYAFQAQDIKESIVNLSRKEQVEADKKTVELYEKAMLQFENLYKAQIERNDDKSNIKKTLQKLQNVYYNLSLLNVNKEKELEDINAQLEGEYKYE